MSRVIRPDSTGSSLAVTTHALSKRYGGSIALDRVGLEVAHESVFALIGPNGAGKSTLLKMLMNLERADSGTANVFGMDVAERGPAVRAQIGYVQERHDPGYRWMRCDALLRHASMHYPAWDHAYAGHLTRALELQPSRKVGGLSKGEARRLQLALALAHRPSLLLLDEPTDGLDPFIRKRVLALLAEHLTDTPTTVVISTHHLHEVDTLADHVGVLRRGVLVAQMAREDLHRTVLRYRVEVPDGWQPPPELAIASPRRSPAGREFQWTLVGNEHEMTERLALAGARVREVTMLPLEEAALAFLPDDESR